MDIDGLEQLLRDIESGAIECLAVDTPMPSLFAHELINAMPYAFLDGEDAAARRTRAVTMRRTLPDSVADGAGRLDQAAIDTVRAQLWPDIRDEHELHDLLLSVVALPTHFLEAQLGAPGPDSRTRVSEVSIKPGATRHWPHYFAQLEQQGRAQAVTIEGVTMWMATERLAEANLLWPAAALPPAPPIETPKESVLGGTEERPAQTLSARDSATLALAQGWLQLLGPTTAYALGERLNIAPRSLHQAFLAMEMQGLAMRGVFENARPADDEPFAIEWCERRILQRIHRLTLRSLREQIEPVTAQVFMRWLLDWHHVAPSTQLKGEEGVLAAIEQLEGFEAPAVEWERTILPRRVADYDPRFLDNLCLAGVLGWGRLSPHPAWHSDAGEAPRRVIPTSAAPVTFFLRESAEWLPHALEANCVPEATLARSLSPEAQQIRAVLADRGAAFTADLQKLTTLTKLQVMTTLWELATAGLASADGFDQLRAMMDPRRKSVAVEQTVAVSLRKRAAARTTTGRWSLLCSDRPETGAAGPDFRTRDLQDAKRSSIAIAKAKRHEAALDAQARILLCRYGVLFRDLLARESNAPKWRDLVPVLRRLEARGEIRGGRFVSGPFGEQYALPEAVDALRAARRQHAARETKAPIAVAAADPLNLVGILVSGERTAALPGREVAFTNGLPPQPELPIDATSAMPGKRRRSIADIVRNGLPTAARALTPVASPSLFQ
jgi:ATP-dependent Lhr-like helicase